MNNSFEAKIRAAAVSGWWTLLIGAAFLAVQWIAYLLITSSRPEWVLSFWGKGMNWDTVQSVWFMGIAIFKLCLWLLALINIWLTLWARRLEKEPRKSRDGGSIRPV